MMEYIAAGIVLLIGLTIGWLGERYASLRKNYIQQNGAEDDTPGVGLRGLISSAALSETPYSMTMKQWLLLFVVAAAASATTFVFVGAEWEVLVSLRFLVGIVFLLFAAIVDYRIRIIPNFLVLTMLIFGTVMLLPQYFFGKELFVNLLIANSLGMVIGFLLFYIMSLVTKGGIGMGDVKLFAAIGWLFGIRCTIYTMFLSLLLCVLISIVLLITRIKKMKDHIPFGPFIYLACCLALVLELF